MLLGMDSSNPNSIGYYLVYIFILLLCYFAVLLVTFLAKAKYNRREIDSIGHSLDNITDDQRNLRFRFLIVTTAIKASVWVRAPYLFALYNRLHGFTRGEIGILYAVDNLSALIMGPILGSFGDIYGRKKFCVLYCFIVAVHVSLRLTGNRPLAYLAQFVAGVSGALIETVFESWLNFEAALIFPQDEAGANQRNYFLRDIFSKQVNIDCYTSIVLTGFASILYLNYGILYPFYACIFFIILAGILILTLWKENNIEKLNELRRHLNLNDNHTFYEKLKYSLDCFKNDRALLSLGVVESCFKISLQLFIFIWTPLLEETAGGYIHPGSVFVCFMIARLMGSELFELFKMILQTNSYIITVLITFTGCASFFVDYSVSQFNVRFFMFVYFDGLAGIFNPLLSSLKSQMIPENLRTTIMNFFRMPINVFSVLTLIFTDYITTYQICLVAFSFMFIGTIINAYLLCIHEPPDAVKVFNKKSMISDHQEQPAAEETS